MPLTNCPECGRQVSTAAAACPQCGHPLQAAAPAAAGPPCYACSATATTRCQSCGAFSCARHLDSIYVSHGKGGGYELRCESCYSSAMIWKAVGIVLVVVVLVVMLVVMSGNRAGPFGR